MKKDPKSMKYLEKKVMFSSKLLGLIWSDFKYRAFSVPSSLHSLYLSQ